MCAGCSNLDARHATSCLPKNARDSSQEIPFMSLSNVGHRKMSYVFHRQPIRHSLKINRDRVKNMG